MSKSTSGSTFVLGRDAPCHLRGPLPAIRRCVSDSLLSQPLYTGAFGACPEESPTSALAKRRASVTAFAPGWVATEMRDRPNITAAGGSVTASGCVGVAAFPSLRDQLHRSRPQAQASMCDAVMGSSESVESGRSAGEETRSVSVKESVFEGGGMEASGGVGAVAPEGSVQRAAIDSEIARLLGMGVLSAPSGFTTMQHPGEDPLWYGHGGAADSGGEPMDIDEDIQRAGGQPMSTSGQVYEGGRGLIRLIPSVQFKQTHKAHSCSQPVEATDQSLAPAEDQLIASRLSSLYPTHALIVCPGCWSSDVRTQASSSLFGRERTTLLSRGCASAHLLAAVSDSRGVLLCSLLSADAYQRLSHSGHWERWVFLISVFKKQLRLRFFQPKMDEILVRKRVNTALLVGKPDGAKVDLSTLRGVVRDIASFEDSTIRNVRTLNRHSNKLATGLTTLSKEVNSALVTISRRITGQQSLGNASTSPLIPPQVDEEAYEQVRETLDIPPPVVPVPTVPNGTDGSSDGVSHSLNVLENVVSRVAQFRDGEESFRSWRKRLIYA